MISHTRESAAAWQDNGPRSEYQSLRSVRRRHSKQDPLRLSTAHRSGLLIGKSRMRAFEVCSGRDTLPLLRA